MAQTQKADFRAVVLEFPTISLLVLVFQSILCFRSNLISKPAKHKYSSSQGNKISPHLSFDKRLHWVSSQCQVQKCKHGLTKYLYFVTCHLWSLHSLVVKQDKLHECSVMHLFYSWRSCRLGACEVSFSLDYASKHKHLTSLGSQLGNRHLIVFAFLLSMCSLTLSVRALQSRLCLTTPSVKHEDASNYNKKIKIKTNQFSCTVLPLQ